MKSPKRVLIKLSWETFWNWDKWNYDFEFMEELGKKIMYLTKEKKMEVVLVSWWWNIFRWAQQSKWYIDEATWHYLGMMATLMNWLAFWDLLKKMWQGTRVMSAIEAPRVVPTFNRNKALRHLEEWKVVLATAGTGNPFCTNDLAAVIRALELNCDVLVKATKVDWVYDKDPMKHSDAKKYDEISLKDVYEKELKIMDSSAIATAMDNKLSIFVCKVDQIEKLWDDDIVGTWARP